MIHWPRIKAGTLASGAYDDEGKVIMKMETATGKVWSYTYDLRNRMTRAVQTQGMVGPILSQIDYTYDCLDRRIAKTVNGTTTTYTYDTDNIWSQTTSVGTTRLPMRRVR